MMMILIVIAFTFVLRVSFSLPFSRVHILPCKYFFCSQDFSRYIRCMACVLIVYMAIAVVVREKESRGVLLVAYRLIYLERN